MVQSRYDKHLLTTQPRKLLTDIIQLRHVTPY
jgi:hypothetical protein